MAFVPTVEVSKDGVTIKINASDVPEYEKDGWKKAGSAKPKEASKPKSKAAPKKKPAATSDGG